MVVGVVCGVDGWSFSVSISNLLNVLNPLYIVNVLKVSNLFDVLNVWNVLLDGLGAFVDNVGDCDWLGNIGDVADTLVILLSYDKCPVSKRSFAVGGDWIVVDGTRHAGVETGSSELLVSMMVLLLRFWLMLVLLVGSMMLHERMKKKTE